MSPVSYEFEIIALCHLLAKDSLMNCQATSLPCWKSMALASSWSYQAGGREQEIQLQRVGLLDLLI